jgi:hypothetical protein
MEDYVSKPIRVEELAKALVHAAAEGRGVRRGRSPDESRGEGLFEMR